MENYHNNYFGLSEDFSSPENSRVAIVPVPYETAAPCGQSTKMAPEAVLKASQHVELFDDELWIEPHKIGIQTLLPVTMEPVNANTEKPFQELRDIISPLIEFDKFPIVLGGEHAISLGAIAACADRYPDLSILQIGAHADLRDAYEGNPYSNASVSYNLYKGLPNPNITQVGTRDISAGEVAWLEEEKPQVNIFWARHQDKWNFQEIISTLSDNVYLSIDVDGLDPGIMPATRTPEPGGMNWHQLIELVKLLCVRKKVIAADIVELAPIPGFQGPDFLVAKLIFKIIGYRYALDLGVTKKYL